MPTDSGVHGGVPQGTWQKKNKPRKKEKEIAAGPLETDVFVEGSNRIHLGAVRLGKIAPRRFSTHGYQYINSITFPLELQ